MLFSHAFLVATGSEHREPLTRLLGEGNILGLYGVYTFFIISGFLLARSLAHDPDPVRFAINRTLRIYPGFVACIFVTALLIGPLGSGLGSLAYFADPGVLWYVQTSLSCMCALPTLPGVFAYTGFDEVRTVVNGSLWSLSFEVLSYLLLAWLWVATRDVRATGVALAVLAAATLVVPAVYDSLPSVNFTLPYFAGGVLMYLVYLRFGLNAQTAVLCFAGLLASAFIGWQVHAYAIFGAYVIAYLGARPNVGSALAKRTGDLSYGIYLYGWPVEQLAKQFTGTDSPWVVMTVALPFVVAAAALSCHLVERPMLRFKGPLSRWTGRVPAMIGYPQLQPAARTAATIVFLVAAFLVLISEKHWWYVTPGLLEVVAASAEAALLTMLVLAAYGHWTRRKRVAESATDGVAADAGKRASHRARH